MKNKILFFAILAIIVVSCSKSELEDLQNTNPDETLIVNQKEAPDLCTLVEITHPVGEEGEWACIKPTSNCFCEEVVITPETKSTNGSYEIFEEFLEAVKDNHLNEFFTNDKWHMIFPMLAEPYAESWLSMLQTNSIILHKVYNPYQDKILFVAFDKGLPVQALIPENSIFTFQVKLQKI